MENAKIRSFKDLIVWQKSADLAVFIYEVTKQFPRDELYGLTSQLRRAAISISSNMAEGFKRSSRKEKLQFYSISLGSLSEVESQLEIARRLNYISEESYNKALDYVYSIGRMLERLRLSAANKL